MLYDRVKEEADKKGISLPSLATQAGIGKNAIYTWKPSKQYPNGVKPRIEALQKVADVLGVSVDYLLGNTDEMRPADNRSVEQKLSDEGMAIATYIDPNAELDEQAMDNIKNYIYEQTMLAKMRIDKERAENGK